MTTYNSLTKSDLKHILQQCGITDGGDDSFSNGYVYTVGLNNSKWLYKCFTTEINKKKSFR